jgi:membrane protein
MREKFDNPVLIAALGVAGLLLGRQRKESPVFRRREQAAAPATGWWAILKRVGREISANQLMTQAAAVTFYFLLSIFPAMAALVSIYGLIADPKTIVDQINGLAGVLPEGGQQLLGEELKTLVASGRSGLGWGLALGIATSLWISNQAMKAMFNALNAVHETKETRGFVRLTAMTMACTAGVLLFTVVALTAVVVMPAAVGRLGSSGLADQLINWLRWPLLLVCITALLAVLYRFGPCREKVVWRWVTWGSAVAAVSWVLVSVLFSWYVGHFGSYNKTYGSLGAVVGFMTWIWISSTVVLIGAQFDAELEKSTAGKQRHRNSPDQAVRRVPATA